MITNQDLKNIEQHLLKNSTPLYQLPEEGMVGDTDKLVMVRGEELKLVSIKDIFDLFRSYNKFPVINTKILGIEHDNLDDVIVNIPISMRCIGQIITFPDKEEDWKIYRYFGESLLMYTDEEYWELI